MKIDFHGNLLPYPLAAMRGRLLLAGLSRKAAEDMLHQLTSHDAVLKEHLSLGDLATETRKLVPHLFLENYDLLTRYESLRRSTSDVPPIILAVEGASATGKSMLALDFIVNLSITRIISTDTVRQVLRGIHTPEDHPELYCHTYQAHKYRQAGSQKLDPIVRGYLAQCELVGPAILTSVERLIQEGTEALVEGVHILPGSLQGLSPSIVEILIHPDEATHRSMFIAKHGTAGLKTVSSDADVRESEFEATRLIQEHMAHLAKKNSIPVVALEDYEQASEEIRRILLDAISHILNDISGGEMG